MAVLCSSNTWLRCAHPVHRGRAAGHCILLGQLDQGEEERWEGVKDVGRMAAKQWVGAWIWVRQLMQGVALIFL